MPQITQKGSRAEVGQLLWVLEKHTRQKPAYPGDVGALLTFPFLSFQSKSQQLAFIKSNETLLTPVPWPVTGLEKIPGSFLSSVKAEWLWTKKCLELRMVPT